MAGRLLCPGQRNETLPGKHEGGSVMNVAHGRKAMAIAALSPCLWVMLRTSLAQSDEGKERKEYADNIRQSYNFRFGTDKPFLPGNPSVQGNDFIQPGAFPKATYCAHCHQQAYSQWRQALHSNS